MGGLGKELMPFKIISYDVMIPIRFIYILDLVSIMQNTVDFLLFTDQNSVKFNGGKP